MSLKKFYYTRFPIVDNKGNKIAEIARPLIEIILKNKRGQMIGPIVALLDSGADYNLFPAYICPTLGINLTKGEKSSVVGVSGDKIITYRHYGINIFVEGYRLETFIDFSDYYRDMPILGQQGFFDKFKKINFDRTNEELILETK